MADANLSTVFSAITMSSVEIAELTGKDHRNVTRDIEKMLNEVGEGVLKFEHTHRNVQNGQEYRCFSLPKNLTLNLITGYRSDIRLKIIDRWMELEAKEIASIVGSAPYIRNKAMLESLKVIENTEVMKAGVYSGFISRADMADTQDGKGISVCIDLLNGRRVTDVICAMSSGRKRQEEGRSYIRVIGDSNGKKIESSSDFVGCVVSVKIGVDQDSGGKFNFVREYKDPRLIMEGSSIGVSPRRIGVVACDTGAASRNLSGIKYDY